MHIVSWNVNGLPTTLKDAMTRYGSLTAFFRDILQADIVCFQVKSRMQLDTSAADTSHTTRVGVQLHLQMASR